MEEFQIGDLVCKKGNIDTKGIILYQEQIMQIMFEIAKFSWATSEMSRKVMTKSKGKDAFNKYRSEFVIIFIICSFVIMLS